MLFFMVDRTTYFYVGKIHCATTFHTGVQFQWVMQAVRREEDTKYAKNTHTHTHFTHNVLYISRIKKH